MIIVLIIFFYIIKKRNSLSEIEKHNNPIYTEICGGRFNFSNYTIPFVKLSIYDKFIVISYTKKIILQFEKIDKIYIKKALFSKGLHIEHHKSGIPKKIIIWVRNDNKILEIVNSKLKKTKSHNKANCRKTL